MSQGKYTKAIPFQWKTMSGRATGHFNTSKNCFVVLLRTSNPAGGDDLEYEPRTTLQDRKEISCYLASEGGIRARKALYKKYAEQQVKTFPGDTVQRSAADAYALLEATGEFQSYLAREIGKDRKNPANTKETLDRDLLDRYLSLYGDRPLCRIDKGVRKTVEQDLAARDYRLRLLCGNLEEKGRGRSRKRILSGGWKRWQRNPRNC